MNKKVPIKNETIVQLLIDYGSPLYVYDEQGIVETANNLNRAFSWAKGYKNYFAVKATPTPAILKLLHKQGMGFDCSTHAELEMVKRLGLSGNDIFYTSNNTPKEDFELAISMGAIINIDDLTQVPVFLEALGDRDYDCVAVRFNPGDKQGGNDIIGKPVEAKYGMRWDQLALAYRQLSNANIKSFGLHTMVASNELDASYFGLTARLLKQAIEQIESETEVKISFVNLGGGFGVNYKEDEEPLDLAAISEEIKHVFENSELEIYTENGRYVTGSHGYLLTKVTYVMDKYKKYVGVDASMHNLMRPGMYGAYHHISVVGKSDANQTERYDVVGALCENNDKFAIDRMLPALQAGDILVIHDAGAHGHAMGFNYNGLLKSAEVLYKSDGTIKLIRRAETIDDYFATIIWKDL